MLGIPWKEEGQSKPVAASEACQTSYVQSLILAHFYGYSSGDGGHWNAGHGLLCQQPNNPSSQPLTSTPPSTGHSSADSKHLSVVLPRNLRSETYT